MKTNRFCPAYTARDAATGCPTVVFGPGSIDQAHTADEWLDLDQLRTAADVLYNFAAAGA
jgi:acetylornithine deacetylase